MARTYEMVLVFDPGHEIEQLDTDLKKFQDVISDGGLARKWERWGKRRLAYEIRGKQYGYYVLCVFDHVPSAVAELDRLARINSAIVRHLMLQVPPAQVPEVDEESVRTLGTVAVVTPPPPEVIEAEVAAGAASGEALEGDVPETVVNDSDESVI